MYGQPIMIPGEWLDEDIPEIKRRQRYINKCKKLRLPKSHTERQIQHLYPLELHCDMKN